MTMNAIKVPDHTTIHTPPKSTPIPPASETSYYPPTSGLLSHVPPSWIPYGELMRITKTTGIWVIYLPHLFGTLYVAASGTTHTSATSILHTNLTLFIYAFVLRSAGCAWNDIQDVEFDRQVRRCRNRPMARGALTMRQGYVFTGALTLVCGMILLALPALCCVVAVPSWGLAVAYPFAKRVTDFPQVVLGVQVAIGVGMGMAAVDANALYEARYAREAVVAFFMANVVWTLVYDFVYAQMDLEDDVKAGVRSMAVRFQDRPKVLLSVMVFALILLLGLTGYWQGFGIAYYGVACGGILASMLWMLVTIDLRSQADCRWWFTECTRLVGWSISGGLALDAFL
ncbi:hypothetical protein HBI80_117410 [Parastagonospora nodorum]|nr:hypothetical protein HBI80_117410 [Parastagonospora nodorum]